MNIVLLKQLLYLSWDYETCSPGLKNKWNIENPSLGQCAITALIANDYLGGKIMRCMSSTGSHYYNLIDDIIIDLTKEQFMGERPQYEESLEKTRDYLLSNEDTKKRYLILKEKIQRKIATIDNKININHMRVKYKK